MTDSISVSFIFLNRSIRKKLGFVLEQTFNPFLNTRIQSPHNLTETENKRSTELIVHRKELIFIWASLNRPNLEYHKKQLMFYSSQNRVVSGQLVVSPYIAERSSVSNLCFNQKIVRMKRTFPPNKFYLQYLFCHENTEPEEDTLLRSIQRKIVPRKMKNTTTKGGKLIEFSEMWKYDGL